MTDQKDPRKPTQIDWQIIWDQLDWENPDRQRQALQDRLNQRAKQYAAPIRSRETTGESLNLLTFHLGAEQYGIDVSVVRGVRNIQKITPVPGAPPFYRGVVNVRGQVITVMDLRLFFNMNAEDRLPPELILVKAQRLELALLADHIEDVVIVPHSEIEPVEMRYAHGVTSAGLVVLDTKQLFSDDRLIVGGVDES